MADWYFLVLLVGICLWTATLYLYIYVDLKNYLLFIGRLNYAAGALVSLGITAFSYYFPWKKFSFPRWVEYAFLFYSVALFFISLFTPLIDASELMTPDGPVVTLGQYYYLYSIHLGASIFLSLFFGLKKMRHLSGLDKVRFQYSFWVFIPVYSFCYLVATILPIFGIIDQFKYMFLIFIPGIIAAFYATIKYRFLDIRFTISKTIRVTLAFALSLIAPFSVYLFFYKNSIQRLPSPYLVPFLIGFSFWFYAYLLKFFNSHTFQKFFGTTATEYFIKAVNRLQRKSLIYTSLRQFQEDIHQAFIVGLRIDFANIVILDETNRQKFRTLIKYSEHAKGALVLKEARLLGQNKSLLGELENLGEVVLPLYHPNQDLLGFLVLGEKVFGDAYSKEEIEALEKAQNNFSLKLTGVLFNSQLQKEVRRKTQSLKKQNERIRELLRQQADFIAVSAHELRTPLSIAILQTEMLENALAETEKREDAKNAGEALHKLQDLVQKLFTVQKYDINKVDLNLEKVRLSDFLAKIFREFEAVMREKTIAFQLENKLENDFVISIDPLQIRQVLQNILSNAAKFTSKNGRAVLRAERRGENILLAVRNSGSPIPDHDKRAIFEKFRSLQTSKNKGLGLGLYLCKKIIELHRGKIWVEDVERQTEFRIQLPIKA
ncbi:MAG: ATP-binding protein [Patescibacteria group bacterium]